MNCANKQNSESDEEDLLMVKIFLNLLISIFLFGFYKINLITPKNKNGEKEKVVEAMQPLISFHVYCSDSTKTSQMASSFTLILLLAAMLVFSAVAQSPASSPKAAATPPAVFPYKPPHKVSPSPAPAVTSPPSPPPSSASSPSPSASPLSISAPPSEAPAPSANAAVSYGFAAAGSVVVGLVTAVLVI
uniref:Uncharacterized protein n=2 Tax=Phaseolus vulgaris TaxID=3885 RepID=V7BTL6_PHAVU|nr:hypothetical protein PHAVU_006G204000g [Phaseolus vulgaris]ESW20378.1 hypothetical protein PHAVU_006G204000g [Phaseolus vulgaris]